MNATWRNLFKVLAAVAGAAWLGTLASAQDVPTLPAAVEERFQKLERQNEAQRNANEALRETNEALRKTNEALLKNLDQLNAKISVQDDLVRVPSNEVQRLVQSYLSEEKMKDVGKGATSGWYKIGSDTKMAGSWNNRLIFESANKDFQAHLGGSFQVDTYTYGQPRRFITSSIGPLDDAMFMRRIRIEFNGTAYENVEFDFNVDLETNQIGNGKSGSSTASAFDDLWVGLKNLPILGNLRIGHVRVPVGLEAYTSNRNLTFLERSSGFDGLLQEYDPGIWMFDSYHEGRFGWAFAAHRIDNDSDVNQVGKGDYAATGKIYGLPYYANEGRSLIHLAAAYQYRSNPYDASVDIKDRDVQFRARPDFRMSGLTPRFVDTGFIVSDHVTTFGLEALGIWGPFSLQAEYFHATASKARYPAKGGKKVGSPSFNSAYILASAFLTGENRTYDKRLGRIDRLIPNENFFLVRKEDGRISAGSGAWELVARYDMIDLDSGAIHGGYMNNYTLGLNWYLNPALKVQWNWNMADRTVPFTNVGGAAAGPSGLVHSLGMRVHWEF